MVHPYHRSPLNSEKSEPLLHVTAWMDPNSILPSEEKQSILEVHLLYVSIYIKLLTYMQNTSREMPGWMKHKLESRLLGEISTNSDIQKTPPLRQKEKT